MATDADQTDPYLTPNAIVRHQKREAPDSPPIGATRMRRAAKLGELPAIRTGHWFRIRLSDFHRWLESQKFEPEPSVADRVGSRVDAQLRRESRIE